MYSRKYRTIFSVTSQYKKTQKLNECFLNRSVTQIQESRLLVQSDRHTYPTTVRAKKFSTYLNKPLNKDWCLLLVYQGPQEKRAQLLGTISTIRLDATEDQKGKWNNHVPLKKIARTSTSVSSSINTTYFYPISEMFHYMD